MTDPPVPTAIHELTALDRCDRCGAQAFVMTRLNGRDLLWCAHHFKDHAAKLALAGALIVADDRKQVK